MKAAILVSSVAVFLASAAIAREQSGSWTPISDEQMGWGTAVCTAGDHDAFCFGLRCFGDGAEWFVFQDGGAPPEGKASAIVVIDNRLHHSLPMERQPGDAYAQIAGEYVKARDAGFLDTLSKGQQIYVAFVDGSGASLTLRGASEELRRTLYMCGVRVRAGRP
ncbi:hypothetical protein [Pannonibacter phragmitetus]|uniref:Uncharacterized protein n=1 Tax=Pannonibacter phragmitetus TaxID=121719 RepID=A0A0U3FMD5_9HYPH|nr:hypothetical protein [Pannonibacter phragmitetus]ALV27374.1 hypothetical protein APZ00_10165 [Pannonibacter phragmitetus]